MPGKVQEVLPESPVDSLAGLLRLREGEGQFHALRYHRGVLEKVKKEAVHGASIWLLAGPVGAGKTWSLAWLARKILAQEAASNDETWALGIVPGVSVGSGPSRALVEAFFRSTENYRKQFAKETRDEMVLAVPAERSRTARILTRALHDDDVWGVLTGFGGQFGRIKGIGKGPRWTSENVRRDFLVEWLSLFTEHGYSNICFLVDEFENVVLSAGRSARLQTYNALRSLFDAAESHTELPRVQIVLSATTDVAHRLKPEGGGGLEVSELPALTSRLSETFLIPLLTKADAFELAEHLIGRKRQINDPKFRFVPYREEAIGEVFSNVTRVIRDFVRVLMQMYFLALEDEADWIDVHLARTALENLGHMSPE